MVCNGKNASLLTGKTNGPGRFARDNREFLRPCAPQRTTRELVIETGYTGDAESVGKLREIGSGRMLFLAFLSLAFSIASPLVATNKDNGKFNEFDQDGFFA